jgi:hypothetical protein
MNTAVQSVQKEKWWKDKDHTEKFKEGYTIGQGSLRKGTDRKEDQYPFLMRLGIRMADSAYECEMPQRP